jgi:hypothetical protein
MAGVEPAHRRDERKRAGEGSEGDAQVGAAPDDVHGPRSEVVIERDSGVGRLCFPRSPVLQRTPEDLVEHRVIHPGNVPDSTSAWYAAAAARMTPRRSAYGFA